MSSLVAQDVCFAYASQPILERITLELRAGEVLVLLGPNGAGKSTLLQTLCRQLRPDSGVVLLNHKDLNRFDPRSLSRSIAFMPQQENRDNQLCVIDVVSLGRTPHTGWWLPLSKNDRQVVQQSLVATGLADLATRPITQLSGGEWRRMILARALAQQATILLLDEPTTGLDLKYQIDVLTRVKNMSRQCNLSVILTLHDLNHAATFGDRLAILCERRLLALGQPREILQPAIIERAFGVPVKVVDHPVHGTPFVVPLYDGEAT